MIIRFITIAAVVVSLSACGGDSGGGDDDQSRAQDGSTNSGAKDGDGDSSSNGGADNSNNGDGDSPSNGGGDNSNNNGGNGSGDNSGGEVPGVSGQGVAYTLDVAGAAYFGPEPKALFLTGTGSPGVATNLTNYAASSDNPRFREYGVVDAFRFSPDGTKLAYIDNFRDALFVIDLANPDAMVKLTDKEVISFQFSPNGEKILFQEQKRGPGPLYEVHLQRPGEAVKISDDTIDHQAYGRAYRYGANGSKIFYVASEYDNVEVYRDLFVVDLDSPGVAKRVALPIDILGVTQYALSPDGTRVYYTAAPNGSASVNLYVTALDDLGVATSLGGTAGDDNGVEGFVLNARANLIVFRNRRHDSLFAVDLSNPHTATQITPTLADGRIIANKFALSPNGEQVIYRADQGSDEVFELYLVDLSLPGVSYKLSDTLVPGGDIAAFDFSGDFTFTPDGSRVIYRADQDTNGTYELYIVNVSSPGSSVKVNAPLVFGGDVVPQTRLDDDGAAHGDDEFDLPFVVFSPDGRKLIYRADQERDDVYELFLVDLATPGVAARLSRPIPSEGKGKDAVYFNFAP